MESSNTDPLVPEAVPQDLDQSAVMNSTGFPSYTRESVVTPVESSIVYPTPLPINPVGVTFFSKNFPKFLLLIVICFIIGGSFVFAYIKKVGPFSSATYTEENFSSNILTKIMQIHSAAYTFSTEVNVVSREADAAPYIPTVTSPEVGTQNTESPKMFLTQMSDSFSMIPPDMKAKIAVTASAESKLQAMTDWSFNITAEGDGGDMSYKINADALRKDDTYYFKINNMPVVFLFEKLASIKGKWVMVPAKAPSPADGINALKSSESGSVESSITQTEELYRQNRDKIIKTIKILAKVADEEKILVFKKAPVFEEIEGRKLTRYELSLRKDKIVTFYIKVAETLNAEFETSEYAVKQEYMDYLKSDEFNQAFDYIDKNNSFVVWVDMDGFPAIVEDTMRVVPPDTAAQLKEKQINTSIKLNITNINAPVIITAPTDSVSFDTIWSEINSETPAQGSALIQTNLSNINSVALALYSSTQSYGTKPFPIGPCQSTAETLFAEPDVVKMLNEITNNTLSVATCAARGRMGKVQVWALSVPIPGEPEWSYCIDSSHSGEVGKIAGKLNKVPVCNF